jgi:hypothetical protein
MDDMPETIAGLAELEQQLMADLAAVRVRISERAGQVDPEPEQPAKKTAAKKTAAK